MAASEKVIENSSRLRYIRALERFHKSTISYLSNTIELTKEGYIKKINNNLKLLQRSAPMALYKGELQELEKLVQKMIASKDKDAQVQDIKDDILYSCNQFDKSKNAKRYKKDKHTSSKYKDWE